MPQLDLLNFPWMTVTFCMLFCLILVIFFMKYNSLLLFYARVLSPKLLQLKLMLVTNIPRYLQIVTALIYFFLMM